MRLAPLYSRRPGHGRSGCTCLRFHARLRRATRSRPSPSRIRPWEAWSRNVNASKACASARLSSKDSKATSATALTLGNERYILRTSVNRGRAASSRIAVIAAPISSFRVSWTSPDGYPEPASRHPTSPGHGGPAEDP